ncbi:MAG: hypothetical protein HRT90_00475, partial [Candidatus Margulisbacteria bacterium]|nr:hypothetical protein [Candidatus Margulisiibacteriota bacterium]
SFEMPAIFEFDIRKVSYLDLDQTHAQEPLSWKIINQSDSKITGLLTFPDIIKLPQAITLYIHLFDPREFQWDLPSPS